MSNKEQKKSYFFPILVIAIFVLAIAFFITSVSLEMSKNKKNMTNQFSSIVELTKNTINQYGINSEFSSEYSKEITKLPNLAAIILSSQDGPFFAFPVSSTFFSSNEYGQPKMTGTSPSLKIFTSNIEYQNSPITLSVALYSISPAKIFDYAKITFIIILCATILVFAVLISVYFKYKKDYEDKTENSISNEDVKEFLNQAKTETENSTENEVEKELEQNDVYTEQQEIKEQETQQNGLQQNDLQQQQERVQSCDSETQVLEQNETSAPIIFPLEELEKNLEEELSKATSEEKDLSLFLIKTKNLSINASENQIILKTILDSDATKSIFAYSDDCYALVVPELNLDGAMQFIQVLYTNLEKVINENELPTKLAIGIATRSLRLIPSERIIKEAQLALDKALQQENSIPVVAFKVDLEKYKQSLAK